MKTFLCDNVDFDSGVSTGVVDLSSVNFCDWHDDWSVRVVLACSIPMLPDVKGGQEKTSMMINSEGSPSAPRGLIDTRATSHLVLCTS